MELLPVLDELIELMKIAAPLATIPLVLMLPWMKTSIGPFSPRWLVFVAVFSVCSLFYAVGTGSCVLGGFVQGTGFCSFRGRGDEWDPVADFYAIQAVWSSVFLLTAFMALVTALALLPGRATGWQRLVFLASAGRRGAWREVSAELRVRIARESDPAVKAEYVALLKELQDAVVIQNNPAVESDARNGARGSL
jgi:hypothetical protein